MGLIWRVEGESTTGWSWDLDLEMLDLKTRWSQERPSRAGSMEAGVLRRGLPQNWALEQSMMGGCRTAGGGAVTTCF